MKSKPTNFHTSQQLRGEHHNAEGNSPAQAPGIQWGNESAPTGNSTKKVMAEPTLTTGNFNNLSTPES